MTTQDNTTRQYSIIIETDKYAGNFEREMTAYITGCVGDCGNGGEYAEMFIEEFGEELDYIRQVADEHGCYRPCTIRRIDGDKFNCVEIFFDRDLTREELQFIAKRAKEFLNVDYKDYEKKLMPTKILGIKKLVTTITETFYTLKYE